MNSFFIALGIESWKPLLTALVLPPVPLLVLLLVGARLILPRRGLGWFVIVFSVAALWFSACSGSARALSQLVLHTPPTLSADRIAELKAAPKTTTAIVVLGGGMEPFAPEYGVSNLRYPSLERLRYGLWLSRETGLPVAFSGGMGWGQPEGTAEARIAGQIAATEYGRPLRWIEENSRDTRENALYTVKLLKKSDVRQIVLVTHGWHMRRAVRAFEQAAAGEMRIEPAPMGLAPRVDAPALDWIPTPSGTTAVRNVLREWLGWLLGA